MARGKGKTQATRIAHRARDVEVPSRHFVRGEVMAARGRASKADVALEHAVDALASPDVNVHRVKGMLMAARSRAAETVDVIDQALADLELITAGAKSAPAERSTLV